MPVGYPQTTRRFPTSIENRWTKSLCPRRAEGETAKVGAGRPAVKGAGYIPVRNGSQVRTPPPTRDDISARQDENRRNLDRVQENPSPHSTSFSRREPSIENDVLVAQGVVPHSVQSNDVVSGRSTRLTMLMTSRRMFPPMYRTSGLTCYRARRQARRPSVHGFLRRTWLTLNRDVNEGIQCHAWTSRSTISDGSSSAFSSSERSDRASVPCVSNESFHRIHGTQIGCNNAEVLHQRLVQRKNERSCWSNPNSLHEPRSTLASERPRGQVW